VARRRGMSLVTAGLLVAAVIALLKGAWSASGLLTVISVFIEHRSGSSDLLARWKTRATPDAPARLTLQGKLIVTGLAAVGMVALGLLGYTVFGHGKP
jgi:hypothetical protein